MSFGHVCAVRIACSATPNVAPHPPSLPACMATRWQVSICRGVVVVVRMELICVVGLVTVW